MNEDYVSFKLAKKLKLLNFNSKTRMVYDEKGKIFKILPERNYNKIKDFYSCPTLALANKFIRNKYDCYIEITLENRLWGDYFFIKIGMQYHAWDALTHTFSYNIKHTHKIPYEKVLSKALNIACANLLKDKKANKAQIKP